MHKTHTIDIRGLEHEERKRIVYPSLEALMPGEKLKIIMEFNPTLLAFVLRDRGDLEITTRQEAEGKWILHIRKLIPDHTAAEQPACAC